MISFIRTNCENQDFIELVKFLDADLAERDGADHAFYSQFNKIAKLKYVIVVYENDRPLGCGAFKEYDSTTVEIKRMYVLPENRRKRIASGTLVALENWATELFYKKCILETGENQPEAIRLYNKNGYQRIPNYGQYVGVEHSVCFEKQLMKHIK